MLNSRERDPLEITTIQVSCESNVTFKAKEEKMRQEEAFPVR
jgi:hypothetical protein